MNKHSILFIGLDTHKEFNEVAYIEEHRGTNLRKKKLNKTATLFLIWLFTFKQKTKQDSHSIFNLAIHF
ncbi:MULTISPECIES: hypothetical protein [unclassified Pseudoalteromonas]|uniref:hypothetical protein n=1 Tax=unclassified Pseudoalteromonas TaxID=194690 RepID=UPI0004673C67|nr:hypothetical protein [Pseudoalteromonas sp. NZS71]